MDFPVSVIPGSLSSAILASLSHVIPGSLSHVIPGSLSHVIPGLTRNLEGYGINVDVDAGSGSGMTVHKDGSGMTGLKGPGMTIFKWARDDRLKRTRDDSTGMVIPGLTRNLEGYGSNVDVDAGSSPA